MNQNLILLLVAVSLAGCANRQHIAHTSQFYDLSLSPENRTNTKERVTLLSIGHRGRVTICARGTVYSARTGERFSSPNGGWTDYTLKSVDTNTGRAIITSEMRLYY